MRKQSQAQQSSSYNKQVYSSNQKPTTNQSNPLQNILDIPQQLGQLQIQGQPTDIMLVKLKQNHMLQQNELVKDLKYMSQESKKIIDEINIIQVDLQKYQSQIDTWIKIVSDMEGFVTKVQGCKDPLQKKSKNMSKLKEFLGGDKPRRR